MSVHYRIADLGDVEQLERLWRRTGLFRDYNLPERDVAFALGSAHSSVIVGEADGALIASVMVGEDGHRGWVYYVAVDPDYQASGLGRELMARAEQFLADRGIWKMQLLVRNDNRQAMGFYESLGFKDTQSVCLQKVIG